MKESTRIVKDFIKTVSLPYRGNCPVCGGNNTFSVSEVEGKTLYRCFRTSCDLKGSTKSVLTLDKTRAILDQTTKDLRLCLSNLVNKSEKKFSSKDYAWSNPLQNEACYGYMEQYGILRAYTDKRCDIRYDPKLNRCVFILKWEGQEYGAVGRQLGRSPRTNDVLARTPIIPKWYVYERIGGCPFIVQCQDRNIARNSLVFVEDSASACRISSITSSVALLGTNFNFSFRYIVGYSNYYICLDDDATGKTTAIQHYLNLKAPTKIIPLKKDLKYLTDEELKKWKTKLLS